MPTRTKSLSPFLRRGAALLRPSLPRRQAVAATVKSFRGKTA
jgi:hypothetical protein